ncbi:MAG: SMC family ATPase, partial [Myxococcota bacterium]|nr:SMC family ATPase [Myxococcota bacterium]
MRPIRIEMHAFGPFGDTQVVDLRELGDASLFHLSGPTGAGKTFIMDGLFFGLFGEACGKERSVGDLRSHYAAVDKVTEVTVDFSVGQEVYRVTRTPQQPRPKQRGEGLTNSPSKATLWRRTGLTDDGEEGSVVADGTRSVTDAVVDLVGLEADQYRKTGILPQGAFRKVISSNSDERAGILARLFGTRRYRDLEEALLKRKKEMEEELKDVQVRRNTVLSEAGVDT